MPEASSELTVSVRRLCAFAAQAGDLDLRFTPAPTALQGMAGHRLVQARRGPDYETEVTLDWRFEGLRVRGRADGFDPQAQRLEEIKTCRGAAEGVKPNQRALHWAQARAYAAMLCIERKLPGLRVALVYFDLDSETETTLEEQLDAATLCEQLQALAQRYLGWARSQARRAEALSQALSGLSFPRPAFRPGQLELSRRIYQASAARRCLLAQAPTGIGKTLASIYPMLKAKAQHRIDKVYFLTAKTPGRAVALEALRELRDKGTHDLRVLEIEARESACVHPGAACHGEACPLARGFYDRLPAAREEAAAIPVLDRAGLSKLAANHAVCPYFLAQEMAHWCDVIVGDFNYYFHPSAFLYVLAREEEWQVSLLVDEAHNLLERARAMYSAQLSDAAFDAARKLAPPAAARALKVLRTEWRRAEDQCAGDALLDTLPDNLLFALRDSAACLAEHFNANPKLPEGPLHALFFEVLQFARLAESFDEHSVLDFSPAGDARQLALRNLIPAPFLRPRFAAARSCVCFSGTLSPFDFYRDTLGLPENTATIDVDSPFEARQLDVHLARALSTRLEDRPHSLSRLVDILAAQFERRPGNYLAFFSSFEYLDMAADALALRHPQVPAWSQRRGMRADERSAFVERFRTGGTSGIGFAVLGGIFGEGVDLPGEQLVGAFIATLGLPQHDPLNERMRARMEERFGNGYAYTYLYPGIRKVVQAAGRVIRSESDEGVVWLLDERFARPEVARLLPAWWEPRLARI
ncbi:ATP-dependent DNA helicase [Variovorax sp. OV329]|uniref:ATP-dependent DNA helicase n=1 Tax=Variovorax sp. OV329 TaxID=1882825 RepID=UPI0008F1C1ED|nr:ATP-dependent DNA helicase [Variovorax sp. OV329]SFM45691.1 DNA excision repair protein ERCC-2 [Variovorax sp. OV329]